ncbi:MAG: transglycosylase domain-containing protein [Rhodoglobus sp.]
MSAQNPPLKGIISGLAGLLGFSALAGVLVTAMVAPAIAVTGVTASSAIGVFDKLPDYITIGTQAQRNEIWATYTGEGNVNGQIKIATLFDQNREEVSYEQISPYALSATVDGEDARFFEHGGIDISSIVRATVGNASSGSIESGASTLSMQLVKNIGVQQALNLDTEEEREAAYKKANEQSLDRKLKEMKQAIALEKKYTKKEVLTAYLNIANFGNATYGIQAAAQRYYSVNASDLTPAQAASLVAIVQGPSDRNPGDPENYKENQDRRDYILDAMLKAGHLTKAEHKEAVATPVDETTVKPSISINGCVAAHEYAKWFCDYVRKSVKDFEFLGADEEERTENWKRGGYKLYTTLDMDVQIPAQTATWAYAPNTETEFALGSATSTVQPGTGRVLVMTQNKIFDDTLEGAGSAATAVNFNTSYEYGGSSGFQPGSTYKVFTLLEWLRSGKSVNERLNGNPDSRANSSNFPNRCEGRGSETFGYGNNANETGTFTVRDGTVRSINGVFFSMAKQLDLCDIRDMAAEMGVERADGEPLETNPTSIIGTNEVTPLSMASSYAAIAANGMWCKPIIVDSVIKPTGETVPGQEKECAQAVTPNIAHGAADVLKGVIPTLRYYPDDGVPIFAKTGTTDRAKQTWVATGTSATGTAVWVGNIVGDRNITQSGLEYADVSGLYLRHAIMGATVSAANQKYGGQDWPKPEANPVASSGQPVPDVRGASLSSAKTVIENIGFGYADGGAIDSSVEAGKVVGTDPEAGVVLARGATVTVYTSKGNQVAFPDVVGDGLTYDFTTARSQIQAAGYPTVILACTALEQQGADPILPTDPRIGKIQASDPAPGTPTVPGATVTLGVGKITC